MDKPTRWERRKAKHRKDGNHGKRGWVGGNPRYNGRNSHTGILWFAFRVTDRRFASYLINVEA